jgi:hypothetical protein
MTLIRKRTKNQVVQGKCFGSSSCKTWVIILLTNERRDSNINVRNNLMQWFTPIILATWEVEIGRITV